MLRTLIAFLLSTVSVTAFAQPKTAPAPMGPPKPAPQLSELSFYVGNWTCSGTQSAGPMGPERKTNTAFTFKMDVSGFWLNWHGKDNANGMEWAGYGGWDGKQFVRFDFQPGAYITFTTAGFQGGDKSIFNGDMNMGGKKMPIRHTITKKGDSEFASLMELQGPDGKWAKLFDESCKKGAAKK